MRAVLYRTIQSTLFPVCLLVFFLFGLPGCSSGRVSGTDSVDTAVNERHRETVTSFLLPSADKEITHTEGDVKIDASNTSEGYLMLSYSGDADTARVQVTDPGGIIYTYVLPIGEMVSIPLSGGDGTYHIDVLEHAFDDMYALCCSWDTDVTLSDEFKPFLYPNVYCWYTKDSRAVQYGTELSDTSSDDLDYVGKVYHYVTENITYDANLAAQVPVNYVPDVDKTMESGTGICFDYASLMAAMLRSQEIPTRLEVGYSGQIYHAWISVYLKETGWIDRIIEFDGKSWSLMDPTLAASNSAGSVKKYIGDGSNYTVKYTY